MKNKIFERADKIESIENELKKYPKGIWVNLLAKKMKIPRSTLNYYLFGIGKFGGYLRDKIEKVEPKEELSKIRLRRDLDE